VRESVILSAILNHLPLRGDVFAWRNNTGQAEIDGREVRFGKKGSADILGVWAPSGRFIAIETKTKNGILSEDQKRWSADFIAFGGLYIIARSVHDVENSLGPPKVKIPIGTAKRVYHGAIE
jgi:hypothetical protein